MVIDPSGAAIANARITATNEDTAFERFLRFGTALFAVFLVVESRVAAPLVRLSLFRRRNLATANAVAVLWAAAMFAWFFLSALYLQAVLGYTPLEVGPVDLCAVADEVAKELAPILRRHTVARTYSQQPIMARGSSEMLRRLLGYLLENASKYAPAGGTIDIYGWRQEDRAFLAITDDMMDPVAGCIKRH